MRAAGPVGEVGPVGEASEVRKVGRIGRTRPARRIGRIGQGRRVGQVRQQGLDQSRVAAGGVPAQGALFGGEAPVAGEPGDGVGSERRERMARARRPGQPGDVGVLTAFGDQQQDRQPGDPAGQVAGPAAGDRVRTVQVVDGQQHGPGLGGPGQQVQQLVEDLLFLLGAGVAEGDAVGGGEDLAHEGKGEPGLLGCAARRQHAHAVVGGRPADDGVEHGGPSPAGRRGQHQPAARPGARPGQCGGRGPEHFVTFDQYVCHVRPPTLLPTAACRPWRPGGRP